MELLLNIIILMFEILYYSLFMKFTKKEGKIHKYLLSFLLITFIIILCNSANFITYFIFVILSLLSLKYIVKVKTSFFDILIIFIMLFLKILIETPLYILLYTFINNYIIGLIVNIIKIIVLLGLRNKLNGLYKYLNNRWNNNDFYIRYIFSTCCFVYCIITAILLIKYSIG